LFLYSTKFISCNYNSINLSLLSLLIPFSLP
jgi:hypothetical protein